MNEQSATKGIMLVKSCCILHQRTQFIFCAVTFSVPNILTMRECNCNFMRTVSHVTTSFVIAIEAIIVLSSLKTKGSKRWLRKWQIRCYN